MSFRNRFGACLIVAVAFILSCAAANQPDVQPAQSMVGVVRLTKIQLPARLPLLPRAIPRSNRLAEGKMPTPAPGFEVSLFAENSTTHGRPISYRMVMY